MRRVGSGSGLEGAPDIMLLTMAGLMVAIVWLVSHAQEATLPPIELPASDASRLGAERAETARVTLRPLPAGGVGVWLEERRLDDGLAGLESALLESAARALTLRADVDTRWQQALEAMTIAARLGLPVEIAAEP